MKESSRRVNTAKQCKREIVEKAKAMKVRCRQNGTKRNTAVKESNRQYDKQWKREIVEMTKAVKVRNRQNSKAMKGTIHRAKDAPPLSPSFRRKIHSQRARQTTCCPTCFRASFCVVISAEMTDNRLRCVFRNIPRQRSFADAVESLCVCNYKSHKRLARRATNYPRRATKVEALELA